MIELNNISLKFDDKSVFEDFSAKINQSQHTCFAGASGSGKSTILKLIQGYVVPTKGEVLVNSLQLNPENVATIRSLIAYIPQNIHLPVDNCLDLVRMLGVENKKEVIILNCENMGLPPDYYTRKFDQMSGGQKQRIIISVCFSLDCQIILLDEPTASLDAESAELVMASIETMKHKTIVSASHNPIWMESADNLINL